MEILNINSNEFDCSKETLAGLPLIMHASQDRNKITDSFSREVYFQRGVSLLQGIHTPKSRQNIFL